MLEIVKQVFFLIYIPNPNQQPTTKLRQDEYYTNISLSIAKLQHNHRLDEQ